MRTTIPVLKCGDRFNVIGIKYQYSISRNYIKLIIFIKADFAHLEGTLRS